ncbi:hypothetical protein FAF44_44590 [Nonomuraea sp. MG754425]|uniref:hypothetical protein n=1 Tax=Nonomuraea sp. MG754425 TaxID=2570319 RepID=UPI001F3BD0FD|nr:hypothetical protein [Nonomuraea sp. MG754425]MCF6475390.1 hypothetical protein [Nonomuraea sp. MG754425]
MLYAGAVFRSPEVSAMLTLERYSDPAPSCYVVPPIPYQQSGWKYTWQNNTDSEIVIYPSSDCTGPALTTVAANGGYAETSRNAKSFEVLG